MQKFYMFYGCQAYEFERPELNKKAADMNIEPQRYNANIKATTNNVNIKSSKTKAVIKA